MGVGVPRGDCGDEGQECEVYRHHGGWGVKEGNGKGVLEIRDEVDRGRWTRKLTL